jgi:hypothetical protein
VTTIYYFTQQVTLVRRSTVQNLPFQLVFLGGSGWQWQTDYGTELITAVKSLHYRPLDHWGNKCHYCFLRRKKVTSVSSIHRFLLPLKLLQKWCILLWAQGIYSQHFISFVTYQWSHEARVLHYTRLDRLARDKHSSLLVPFKFQRKMKCCGYELRSCD